MTGLLPDSTAIGKPCIYGNVTIAPGVVMASGVILGTDSTSHLIIATGVCLGPDVVIQVQGGDLVIEANANLGAEVLVVGSGRVGAYTCIGSGTTLINPQQRSHQVIAAQSLLGDPSQAGLGARSAEAGEPSPGSQLNLPAEAGLTVQSASGNGQGRASTENDRAERSTALPGQPQNGASNGTNNGANNGTSNGTRPVYGRAQVTDLLHTLFPHR